MTIPEAQRARSCTLQIHGTWLDPQAAWLRAAFAIAIELFMNLPVLQVRCGLLAKLI